MPRAVILAGGLGTRLRPYTTVLPKPLMPVGERPILDIVLRQLKRDGFDHITIATGYLAELIEAFFGDGSRLGLRIDYFREEEPLGTVGALALIDGLDDDVLVMNGDVLTTLRYDELLAEHRASGAAATISTHPRRVDISLGVLEFADDADDARITDYFEKPKLDYEASMGVYCFAPRALGRIEAGQRLDFPDLVLRLVAEGEPVRAFRRPEAMWLDIGRHEDYEEAQEAFERHRAELLDE